MPKLKIAKTAKNYFPPESWEIIKGKWKSLGPKYGSWSSGALSWNSKDGKGLEVNVCNNPSTGLGLNVNAPSGQRLGFMTVSWSANAIYNPALDAEGHYEIMLAAAPEKTPEGKIASEMPKAELRKHRKAIVAVLNDLFSVLNP